MKCSSEWVHRDDLLWNRRIDFNIFGWLLIARIVWMIFCLQYSFFFVFFTLFEEKKRRTKKISRQTKRVAKCSIFDEHITYIININSLICVKTKANKKHTVTKNRKRFAHWQNNTLLAISLSFTAYLSVRLPDVITWKKSKHIYRKNGEKLRSKSEKQQKMTSLNGHNNKIFVESWAVKVFVWSKLLYFFFFGVTFKESV